MTPGRSPPAAEAAGPLSWAQSGRTRIAGPAGLACGTAVPGTVVPGTVVPGTVARAWPTSISYRPPPPAPRPGGGPRRGRRAGVDPASRAGDAQCLGRVVGGVDGRRAVGGAAAGHLVQDL